MSHEADRRLRRAMQLALQINNSERVAVVRNAMFGFAERLPSRYVWSELFDLFIDGPKINTTRVQRDEIIRQLEQQLGQTCSNPTGAGSVETQDEAIRLARYYKKVRRPEEARRVILTWGNAVERLAVPAADFLALAWLEDVFKAYRDNGLKEEAKRVQLIMKQKGAETEQAMPTLTASITIPAEELDEFLEWIVAEDAKTTLQRIAVYYIAKLKELRQEIAQTGQRHPLLSMVTRKKLDQQQVIGKIGGVESDPEAHLIDAITKRIEFSGFFLAKSLDRAIEKHSLTAGTLLEFIRKSVFFDDESLELVGHGLEAFFASDHVKAIHVLLPQIESALRTFLGQLDEPTNAQRRGDSTIMVERTLTSILEEPVIKQALGEDVLMYLLSFLADARGHNLRNRVMHGLLSPRGF